MPTIIFILVLFIGIPLSAQDFNFQLEAEAFPVEINGWQPHSPWSGGFSESSPEFADLDGDGDLDLFIGNFQGEISQYNNIGTEVTADFIWITHTFENISLGNPVTYSGRTSPEFCDIDGDSDLDLFSGDFQGLIHYWENIGSPSEPEYQFITDSLEYIDVPGFSKLCFCDIDSDDDYDLFIGNYFGKIWFYINEGNSYLYQLSLVTEEFLNIDVGYNADPCFIDIDNDHDYDLFIGERYGKIWYYRNDGDSVNYNYTMVSNYYENIDVGEYSSPEFADIDADGDYDLFIGREHAFSNNRLGDVFYYENSGTSEEPDFDFVTSNYITLDLGYTTMPQLIDINNDDKVDMIVSDGENLVYFENTGTVSDPHFILVDTAFQNIEISGLHPWFVDIDADDDYDLLCGEAVFPPEPPVVSLYINMGTPENANLVLEDPEFITNSNFNGNTNISCADIDADDDYDLFITDNDDYLYFYRNDGSPQYPDFTLVTNQWQGISYPYPYDSWRGQSFEDLDDDGDLDLLIKSMSCYNLDYYENIGTPQEAIMELVTEEFLNIEICHAFPYLTDIDNDDDFDLFCGDFYAGFWFFRNNTVLSVELLISMEGNDIILTWSSIANAVEYRIFYQNIPYFTPSGTPQAVVLPPDTSWTDYGAVNEGGRYYRVVVEGNDE